MLLKEVSPAHRACIYLIKNTVKTEILLQFKIAVFCEYILKRNLFRDQIWFFSIIT